ncbi:MAG TPA: hypothetical protein VM198_08660 [Longimicrobiales bacterium]|nr:hypothetical protein [Longimicrobiales bacterium]
MRHIRLGRRLWDPDPEDTTYRVEYALLVREPGGSGEVRVRHDRHLEGLFATEEWVGALRRSGFTPDVLRHRHEGEAHESVVFVGTTRRE